MNVLVLAICAILGASATVVSGKTFGKCELAKILVDKGIAKSAVPDCKCTRSKGETPGFVRNLAWDFVYRDLSGAA